MSLFRRLIHLRRLLRLIPRLLKSLDALEHLVPKLEMLNPILGKLGELDERVAELEVLGEIIPRFETLDQALVKLAEVGKPAPVQTVVVPHQANGKHGQDHEMERLRLLSRFASLAGKARDIELEWQKIQQEENDAFFAFQTLGRGNSETIYVYKKGIADGIKWCITRFA